MELKRTRFQPRVVSLGSRALLCINSDVKNLPNSAAADKCKDLRDVGLLFLFSPDSPKDF